MVKIVEDTTSQVDFRVVLPPDGMGQVTVRSKSQDVGLSKCTSVNAMSLSS